MKELIARLAVTEGNRELDYAIHGTLFPRPPAPVSEHVDLPVGFGTGAFADALDPRPDYTTSRDAADTLMPDGWTCEILLWFDNQYGVPAVEVIARKKDAMVEVTAITHGKDAEARARCIAALRARDAGDDHASQE